VKSVCLLSHLLFLFDVLDRYQFVLHLRFFFRFSPKVYILIRSVAFFWLLYLLPRAFESGRERSEHLVNLHLKHVEIDSLVVEFFLELRHLLLNKLKLELGQTLTQTATNQSERIPFRLLLVSLCSLLLLHPGNRIFEDVLELGHFPAISVLDEHLHDHILHLFLQLRTSQSQIACKNVTFGRFQDVLRLDKVKDVWISRCQKHLVLYGDETSK